MSKYTTETRYIVEQAERDATGGYTVGRYTSASYAALGLATYVIFDEAYRSKLNDKIINHFYFREIGFETRGHFAFQMQRTLNEIMPYYNILYQEIQDVHLKPFTEIDMYYEDTFGETKDTERGYTDNHLIDSTQKATRTDNLTKTRTDDLTSTRTDNLSESGTNETTAITKDRNVFQDTPMSMLDTGEIENLEFATTVTYDNSNDVTSGQYNVSNTGTQATKDTGTQKTSDTGTQTTVTDNDATNKDTGDSTEVWKHGGSNERHEHGRRHSQAYLFKEYMDAMINIDMMVIADLETLFMGVW